MNQYYATAVARNARYIKHLCLTQEMYLSMTVGDLRKMLAAFPKDALVVLSVEVEQEGQDDHFTVDQFAEFVTLRPDKRVQIGDKFQEAD